MRRSAHRVFEDFGRRCEKSLLAALGNGTNPEKTVDLFVAVRHDPLLDIQDYLRRCQHVCSFVRGAL
jgi:hypothetical protein